MCEKVYQSQNTNLGKYGTDLTKKLMLMCDNVTLNGRRRVPHVYAKMV